MATRTSKSAKLTDSVENTEEVFDIAVNLDMEEVNTEDVLSDINKTIEEIAGISNKKNSKVVDRSEPHSIGLHEKIVCKSLYMGKLTYKSPVNGATYSWAEYGATRALTFSELESMSNHKPTYLYTPFLLIDDARAVDYFNLTETYEKMANISKLSDIFNTGDLNLIREKIREFVTVNQRETILSHVRKMRKENKLVNIDIIKILNEELKSDVG